MYSLISVKMDVLPANTRNRESTRSWPIRVRLLQPWADLYCMSGGTRGLCITRIYVSQNVCVITRIYVSQNVCIITRIYMYHRMYHKNICITECMCHHKNICIITRIYVSSQEYMYHRMYHKEYV